MGAYVAYRLLPLADQEVLGRQVEEAVGQS